MKPITITLFVAIGVGLCFATPDPEPIIVDTPVGGVLNRRGGNVVGESEEIGDHLFNFGGRGGSGDRDGLGIGGRFHLLNNLPLKHVIMRVRHLLAIHPIGGSKYCSCPREENYHNYQPRSLQPLPPLLPLQPQPPIQPQPLIQSQALVQPQPLIQSQTLIQTQPLPLRSVIDVRILGKKEESMEIGWAGAANPSSNL